MEPAFFRYGVPVYFNQNNFPENEQLKSYPALFDIDNYYQEMYYVELDNNGCSEQIREYSTIVRGKESYNNDLEVLTEEQVWEVMQELAPLRKF